MGGFHPLPHSRVIEARKEYQNENIFREAA